MLEKKIQKRKAFFISDKTGITSEMLGHSILSQFDEIIFIEKTIPFIDTEEKAFNALDIIDKLTKDDTFKPIIFSTLVDNNISKIIQNKSNSIFLDCFQIFIAPLEKELGVSSSHSIGKIRSVNNTGYFKRIEAVNFALQYDDGQVSRDLSKADIVLIGVSRCGKTPTCLFLAMQYGIKAANYPIIPEDFLNDRLPEFILKIKNKVFGLSIDPQQLSQIREKRRPNSEYASYSNCIFETQSANKLMSKEKITFFDMTNQSIEEISSQILQYINWNRNQI